MRWFNELVILGFLIVAVAAATLASAPAVHGQTCTNGVCF
jgi:hypothetical protein